ncbi:MAG: monovalent cation:proton antiporter-2 (CPA2) family protein [Verrucomicrobiota bacterium]
MAYQSLFTAAFVYLLAAVISVPLAKRLGLSAVLGYLVAGMVIGPFGLQLIGEEGQDVMHFAEFGVVMMLFLIGLELQPAMLWRMRSPILGLGGAQVALTTLAVTALGIAFGLNWQIALAVGMALALSSTAIVMQSLQEKGLSATSGGRSAFSVLLFQDIAVIPMLATFPLLATLVPEGTDVKHGGEHVSPFQDWLAHQPGWVNTLLVLGAVVGIIIAGRFLLRPILRWVAGTGVREVFVALALLLIIAIALLMTSLGVSAALGTFLAGVVLADSEYRHELEADIEPFKGLLLGVFFIAVGASIDFSLIVAKPAVILGIVLGLMTLKAGILLLLGKLGRLALDQRFLFALSLAQGSEFAFVLLGFGVAEGVFTLELTQVLVASVALTMALTPIVMIFEERVLRKKFGTKTAEERNADEIDENADVILVGVGRFGNFVARMLRAQKIDVTVIDRDSDHIDFLRKLGIKAFYGDACRHDILESAGAGSARLLIIAIDDEETITSLIEVVREYYPQLKIMVRALSRNHQYRLLNEGVDYSIHQNSASAIELSKAALAELGFRAYRANRLAKAFAEHDSAMTQRLSKVHKDERVYMAQVRSHLAEIESQFEEDRSLDAQVDAAWSTHALREAIKENGESDMLADTSSGKAT